MVLTGIEIAALILAILPVVISAAEHYRDGLQPLREWKRYPREVDSLYWDLKGQLCLFRNTCEVLLRSVGGEDFDASTLADLLNNPEGDGWKDTRLEERLAQVLQESYPIFIHCIEEIWRIVKALDGDLQAAQEQETSPTDASKLSKWRAKKQLERIRFTWSKSSRTKLIESLKAKTYLLSELTKGTVPLAKLRLDTDPTHSVVLRSMRVTASNLYAALERSWCCRCQASHAANLRLETRIGGGFGISHGELLQHQSGSDGFRILFCLDPPPQINQQLLCTWKAADVMPWKSEIKQEQDSASDRVKKVAFAGNSQELMPVDPPEIASESSQIRSLCDVVREDSKWIDVRSDCLGFLLHQSGASYGLYSVQDSWMRGAQSSMTLSDMLSGGSGQVGTHHNGRLLCKDRIEVALQLACSVLQLHSSPWLSEQWTSGDIVLLHKFTDTSSHLLLETYIRRAFRGSAGNDVYSAGSTGTDSQTRFGIRNEVLFALGLVLLELAYNRPMADFRQPEDLGDDGTPNAFTDMSVAARLELTLEREVGPVYATVVRRCLHCTFDVSDTDLRDEKFHRAVYIGVVKPLLGILKSW